MEAASVRIHHPNRDKPEAKATKAAVILLLLTSAGLTAIVTFGGWSALQGAHGGAIFYILVYGVMAYYVARWNRGVLPVAAALAVIFGVLAAVAGPAWFERDKAGIDDPALESGILGLLTVLIIPVQLLLVAFALRGFSQEWNVEVEVAEGGGRRPATEERPKTKAGTKAVPLPWETGEEASAEEPPPEEGTKEKKPRGGKAASAGAASPATRARTTRSKASSSKASGTKSSSRSSGGTKARGSAKSSGGGTKSTGKAKPRSTKSGNGRSPRSGGNSSKS